MNNLDEEAYQRKQGRLISRFIERAKTRDPVLESDLFELYQQDMKDSSVAQFMLDPSNWKTKAIDETRVFREYMVSEALHQYKDFYESDAEEQSFFEYMGNLSNRDKIRFAEVFKDYSQQRVDMKDYVMIAKREYNPELSMFSNLLLDLQDFKDRVRPLAKDITLMDTTRGYQKQNVSALAKEREFFTEAMAKVEADISRDALEGGSGSRELESGSGKSLK
jgi:cytidylate kinase